MILIVSMQNLWWMGYIALVNVDTVCTITCNNRGHSQPVNHVVVATTHTFRDLIAPHRALRTIEILMTQETYLSNSHNGKIRHCNNFSSENCPLRSILDTFTHNCNNFTVCDRFHLSLHLRVIIQLGNKFIMTNSKKHTWASTSVNWAFS